MRTSSAKAKGRRPMLWLRAQLLERFPQLQPDDIRLTPSGTPGPDLQLSPAAQQVFPYAVESKAHEALNIWAALKQADSHVAVKNVITDMDAETSTMTLTATRITAPLVVFTRNRHKVFVALEADSFLDLVRRAAK